MVEVKTGDIVEITLKENYGRYYAGDKFLAIVRQTWPYGLGIRYRSGYNAKRTFDAIDTIRTEKIGQIERLDSIYKYFNPETWLQCIPNMPIRDKGGYTWYFDGARRLRKRKVTIPTESNWKRMDPNSTVYGGQTLRSGMAVLKEGDNFEDLVYATVWNFWSDPEDKGKAERLHGVDKIIGKIFKSVVERDAGNTNTKMLDKVRIRVGIADIYSSYEETKREVDKYYNEISKRVLGVIEKNKEFKRYRVPINILKVGAVTLTRSNVLEYVFEVKSYDLFGGSWEEVIS